MSGSGVGGAGRGPGRGRGRSGGRGGRGYPSAPAGRDGGGRGRGGDRGYPSAPAGRDGDGRGGGGGGRGYPSAPAGRDSGGRRGGLPEYNAPQSAGPSIPAPEPSASVISREFETKLTVHGSSSASASASVSGEGYQEGSSSASASESGGGYHVGSSAASASESGAGYHEVASQGMELQEKVPPASSKAITFPVRPGYGTVGGKVMVRANHFLVHVAERDVHHYDVTISPEVRSKKVCRDIMKQLQNSYKISHMGNRQLAYDGNKNAYTAGSLPFISKEFNIKLANKDGAKKEREFKVSLKFAAKVDLYRLQQYLRSRQLDVPQEIIQALDVVLRENPSSNYEVVGRSFFHPSLGEIGSLGNGVEYWRGFYQSLRPTQMGLSLNIDVSARGFYEPIPVIEFVANYLNKDLNRPLSDQDRIKVKKVLKSVKVEVVHSKIRRCYKISSITTQSTSQLSFSQNGIEMNIVDYFWQQYQFRLQYTVLPALQVGNDARPVYLPMEVCKIVEGQRYTKKLNERQVSALLRASCQRPEPREIGIKTIVSDIIYNGDSFVSQEFGIQITPELTSIDARVLPPPKLKYHETGAEQLVDPKVGQWNMINKKMINGGKVDNWACVNFSRNVNAQSFCKELIEMCCSKGMVFNENPLIPIQTPNRGSVENALIDIHSRCAARLQNMDTTSKQLQLLIVILPDSSGSYGMIKRVCETELGIVSQCCQPKKAYRIDKQYLENVSLKINVKVGGRNAVLQAAVQRNIPYLTDRVTIIFGADVTHPQPGEDSSPSIAAVVASMDWPEVTKYRALVSAQHHRQEIIEDLYKTDENGTRPGGMIREQLIAFRRFTRRKPERIIFYRDGVSEGQFNQVLLNEMEAIRKACVSLEANYLPRVTFVVVQKRHHTRLFPANHRNRNLTDRSGNILPGTVVDTKICHPTEFDFYLCSHAGIQGTSRPTHYHVLYDENGFNADGLQLLTYNLCYTYARCTRSVSIVPPAYYAHLAAFRARYYIEGEYSESGSTSGGGRATREQNPEVKRLPTIKENVKDVMFYC